MVAEIDRMMVQERPLQAYARLVSHLFFQGRPLTTKYQALNKVILGQFSLIKRLPQMQTAVHKPIFIVGIGRSGTTILGRVLAMHPEIGFLNEPKALWYSVNPRDDLIGTYTTSQEGSYWLSEEDVNPARSEAAHKLYAYYLWLSHSKRVLDKYPGMIFRASYLKSIFPDALFLVIVRNGWDNIQSISRWSTNNRQTHAIDTHDWWGLNNRKWQYLLNQVAVKMPYWAGQMDELKNIESDIDKAAVEWLVTMNQANHLMTTYPADTHLIRYEELTQSPTETMRAILSFCQLPYDEVCVNYTRTTVTPNIPKKPIQLHPVIEAPFLDTMDLFSYSNRPPSTV